MTDELQETGLNRNPVDKYYTKNEVVQLCIELIKKYIIILPNDIIIEPSAGNGSFIQSIKTLSNNYKFYDINPANEEIIEMDFLEYKFECNNNQCYHIIGNPPFGRQASLAIKFIKKCCEFASSISFILPKSFKKDSMKKRFTNHFHLIHEIDLTDNSFLVNGNDSDVPCVFQIWEYNQTTLRTTITKLEPINFEFVKKNDTPDISFRRVGVNAGKIESYAPYEKSSKVVRPNYKAAAPTSYTPNIYKNDMVSF